MHYCLEVKGKCSLKEELQDLSRLDNSLKSYSRQHLPELQEFPVAMRFGETPVPIPNTTVKTRAAESTILATVWEDRWLPDKKIINEFNHARMIYTASEGMTDPKV